MTATETSLVVFVEPTYLEPHETTKGNSQVITRPHRSGLRRRTQQGSANQGGTC